MWIKSDIGRCLHPTGVIDLSGHDPTRSLSIVTVLTSKNHRSPALLANPGSKMSKTTPRRLAYLTTLISGFTAAPEDAASMGAEVSVWISATAHENGTKRSLVRRDLILSNGYQGKGAQGRFATDLLAALKGKPEALLSVLRDGDHEIVLAALSFPVVIVEAPVVIVEEQKAAPVVAVKAPVVAVKAPDAMTLTQAWLAQQITETGLVNRLAVMLRKRDMHADMDDLRSDAGLWLAIWGQKGTFDSVIEEKGSVPFSWLCRALERKRTSSVYKSAQDALARQRGARTQHEINQRVEWGIPDYVAPESLVAGDVDVVVNVKENGEVMHEFVSGEDSPEDIAESTHDREWLVAQGREIIAATYRDAVERYTAVYDALIAGASTEDIAVLDGCPESRAVTLKSKVRGALRLGPQTLGDAEAVLSLLSGRSWVPREDLKQDLRIDMPRLHRALALLEGRSLVKGGWGGTYALIGA